MKRLVFLTGLILLSSTAFAAVDKAHYTLSEIIEFALKNNPSLRISSVDVEIESYGVQRAKLSRCRTLNF